MKKKKIVIINDLIIGGGVENVLYNLLMYLNDKDYDITVITFRGTKEEFYELYPANMKHISCGRFKKPHKRRDFNWFMNNVFHMIYQCYLQSLKHDVVIALKEGSCTKFASMFNAKKKYSWVHVDYNFLYWTKGIYGTEKKEIKCMQRYKQVVCVSEAAKKSVCDVIGNPGNLVVRLNPIDVNSILSKAECGQDVFDDKKIEEGKMLLVSVGRLCQQKGYMRLLECCAKLNQYYDYELWIVGDGPDRDKMEDYICANGLTNVILWGNQENPYPFIKKANWFVTSSIGESYGLVVQEAYILGTPVLATTCPAFEECVSEEYGILVQNTTEGLYEGLEKILRNPELQFQYVRENKDQSIHEEMYTKRLEEIEKLWL